MTNDFAVEQQQRKSPVWPTVGAVAGGVGGYLIGRGKYATHDDIIKEAHDITDIKAKTDSELWQAVLDKEASVKEWDQKIVDASKPTVTGQPLDELNAVKAEIDDAVRAMNERAGSSAGAYDPAKLPKFAELGMEDLPTTYAAGTKKAGKKIKPTDMQRLYERLVQDAVDAHTALEDKLTAPITAPTPGLKTKQGDFIGKLRANSALDMVALAGKSENEVIAYFNDGIRYDSVGHKSYSPQFQRIMNAVTLEYPEPTALTEADIRSIGHVVDPKTPAAPGMSRQTFSIPNPSGRRGSISETIEYDGKAYGDLMEQRKAEVLATRESVAQQIFAESQNTFRLQKEVADFPRIFGEKVDSKICEEVGGGLYNPATDVLDVARIIDPANSSTYSSDIKSMQKSLHNVTLNPYDRTIISKYTTVAGATPTKAECQQALKAANARNRVFTMYQRELQTLEDQVNESLRSNDVFRKYETEIADYIAGKEGEAARKADKALRDQFPNVVKETGAARTYTAEDVGQALKDKLKKAQDAFDAAVKDKGAIDESAKKAAEDGRNAAKKELDEAVNKLINKVGRKGGKPILGAAIGVAAGAGLLWAIAPKKSKN